jgi:hypothetical protein
MREKKHLHWGLVGKPEKIDFSHPSLFTGIKFQEPLLKVKIHKLTAPCHTTKNNGFLFSQCFFSFCLPEH